jgi:ferritin-like metal-binding protein YciE
VIGSVANRASAGIVRTGYYATAMNKTDLTTYLNDHHAGSLAALEMLDHLVETFEGKTLGQFFKELRVEIRSDQHALENLIEKIDADESAIKKAGAWVAEKFSRAKIRVNDSADDQLGLLQALEALMLGITGKRALWTALAAAAERVPQLRALDYATLEQRATEQRDRVEAKRREVARELFSRSL